MFTWALKHIRLIRYYSATPRRTAWTIAIDIGLAASVFLSLPMSWTMDQLVLRAQPPVLVSGKIFEDESGLFLVALNGQDFDFGKVDDAEYRANFDFRIDMSRRGWPFVTSVYGKKPLLKMDIFNMSRGMQPTDLDVDSPMRIAISREMINAGYHKEMGIWDGTINTTDNNLTTWGANVILWTFILAISSWISVWLTRFIYIFLSNGQFSSKQNRVDSGLCAECGYDLRGNQFADRCPECGVLTS